jgi:hypothetical protein
MSGREYSEDLIARIDAPHLNRLSLSLSYQTVFDVSQVPRFIHGSGMFKPPLFASVEVSHRGIDISICHQSMAISSCKHTALG